MIQITKMAGARTRHRGDGSPKKSLKRWLFGAFAILAIFLAPAKIDAQALKFIGTTPENGSTIASLENITFHFDLSDVIASHGEGDWGICCNAYHNELRPAKEKSAALYKGTPEDGVLLSTFAEYVDVNEPLFAPGSEFHISFPNIDIEEGQIYTLKVTLIMYAGRKEVDDWWLESTELSFFSEPLTITFIGGKGSEVKKNLKVDSWSIDENNSLESISSIIVNFNYEVTYDETKPVSIYEGQNTIVSTTDVKVIATDSQCVEILFPEIPLYYGHTYSIVIPSGSFSLLGEQDIINEEVSLSITGASYRYFGPGRIRPSNGSESVMDEITIPFNFPTADDKTYGFVNVDNGNKKWYIHIYEGSSAEGEELMSLAASKIGDDNQSLIFRPNYAFKPETEYTLVIPEGDVLAYEIGAPRETYLKDYISERVELHYTTPSVASLPSWSPAPVNVKDNDEVAELKYFILDNPPYEYDGRQFYTTNKEHYSGRLYLVTDDGEQEIAKFPILRKTLNGDSEIGNGELIGQYNIGEVNATLYEGNLYRVVWLENADVINNAFIGQFIGNPEISVTLKGATPTVSDMGLKANIDDRLHSHADVFSFVTESEVKAGENAKMILKDGEENVAEAPVYVSREANGHRVYADFGGKKLVSGKSYDVVLPEGSVYATNGIVNNPEIKSALTAMPETPAAPEFISVALNIDEYASATYRMVKGEESVLNLKAGEDWKLESLSLNGDDVTAEVAENGLYTLPALDADATLDASYAYAHPVDYDYTTGVGNIEECPYTLGKDAGHLVISNLKGGESIATYTMGGMKIANLPAVPADMHEASIALPEGQVYIIVIDGVSIKYRH